MTLPLRVMPGKVLIQPDIEAQTVEQRESGVLLAKTMAAAVEGSDARESWYTGTVVGVAERSLEFDVRPYLRRKLRDVLDCSNYADVMRSIDCLLVELDDLPQERERGFQVGDAVTFSARAGQQVDIDGTTYLIMAETDVLGVLVAQ